VHWSSAARSRAGSDINRVIHPNRSRAWCRALSNRSSSRSEFDIILSPPFNDHPYSSCAPAVFRLLARQHFPNEQTFCFKPFLGKFFAIVVRRRLLKKFLHVPPHPFCAARCSQICRCPVCSIRHTQSSARLNDDGHSGLPRRLCYRGLIAARLVCLPCGWSGSRAHQALLFSAKMVQLARVEGGLAAAAAVFGAQHEWPSVAPALSCHPATWFWTRASERWFRLSAPANIYRASASLALSPPSLHGLRAAKLDWGH